MLQREAAGNPPSWKARVYKVLDGLHETGAAELGNPWGDAEPRNVKITRTSYGTARYEALFEAEIHSFLKQAHQKRAAGAGRDEERLG